MTHKIHCVRLKREAEGLDKPPFPGEQGQKIYDHVSKEAWKEWLKMQTMLINEHRLTPFEPSSREFLAKEREKFLFGGVNVVPEGYRPPSA